VEQKTKERTRKSLPTAATVVKGKAAAAAAAGKEHGKKRTMWQMK
jgi:hypothetical protein